MRKLIILLAVVCAGFAGWHVIHNHPQKPAVSTTSTSVSSQSQTPAPVNYCAGNKSGKKIIVSISKQHLWACSDSAAAYDSAVVTGMERYPSELTPKGTYTIYAKQTDQTLAGHDFTGSWNDFVYYWMPFLNNQYGTYGFHDITQAANGTNGRADTDFGHIDINAPYTAAKHGSHGCVELPLATAKWLYNWAQVGTVVKIQA